MNGFVRLRQGAGLRPHDDQVQTIGRVGNVFADMYSAEYSDAAGNKLLGARGAAVADGVASAAASTQAEFNALVTQFNALLARVRAHGLIAT